MAPVWLPSPTNLHSVCTNPEIPGEKCAKSGRVGGWEVTVVAVLLSVVFRQKQALSHGLWVLCAKMGVAWCILGVGEVSDPYLSV